MLADPEYPFLRMNDRFNRQGATVGRLSGWTAANCCLDRSWRADVRNLSYSQTVDGPTAAGSPPTKLCGSGVGSNQSPYLRDAQGIVPAALNGRIVAIK
jgi:hypothetical protein